jgi:hypothetical protein
MEKLIKCVVFKANNIVITEIAYIMMDPDDISGANCKFINPYKIDENGNLKVWLDVTDQNEIMINSDTILTVVDPKPEIIEKYLELTAE